jgi:hypothetical protein
MNTRYATPRAVRRRNHYDVTGRVRISHPDDVRIAVCELLAELYPDADLAALRDAFRTFGRLYAGTLPGYAGCDTWYHDAQHSLDCALAMARLLDGHERSVPAAQKLGARRAVLGVLIALFHDAGYIRRRGDHAVNGAEFTLTHVHRSGEFLRDYLPKIGFGDDVRKARQIVHFTGYEIALDKIQVRDAKDRMLGFLLGSADVLAQTSDRCYLEKCRDFLFREFALAARRRSTARPTSCWRKPSRSIASCGRNGSTAISAARTASSTHISEARIRTASRSKRIWRGSRGWCVRVGSVN